MPFLTSVQFDERLRAALREIDMVVKLQLVADAVIQSIASGSDATSMSTAFNTEIARRKNLDFKTRNTGG